MYRNLCSAVAGIVLLFTGATANAAVVTVNFTGTWTGVDDSAGGPAPAVGDTFTASVQLDTLSPMLPSCGPACYNPFSPLTLTTDGNTYATAAANTLIVSAPTLLWHINGTDSSFDSPTGPSRFLTIRFDLFGNKPTDSILPDLVPSGTSVELQYLIYSDFFTTPSGGFVANGEISSFSIVDPSAQVPVPAALPLFATGLGALGFAVWRRRRQTA